ncbi:unnamed protein product [Zymoseptoria tritici ST99CH_1E4]|uniref:Uncharacterized protein n=1 Tax=Zymoseptoria tritici ST99CH_1E4 TaxID=1276532 RepID=A0A2H1GYT6_ZYMTR|nr:unnamed protein product [Zymoseptoria tritici ST99CH_1E4]
MALTLQLIIYIAQLTIRLLDRLEIWLTNLHAYLKPDLNASIARHNHHRAMQAARTNAELDYARRWFEFRRNEAMQMAHIRGAVEHARFEAREARAVRRAEEWIMGEGLVIRVGGCGGRG